MAEYLSIYLEDKARNDNAPVRELDVYSPVPPEQLNQIPPASIAIARCHSPGGCEIHAPLGNGKDGIPETRLMFTLDERDDGYPHDSLYVPFSRMPGKKEFVSRTHNGERAYVTMAAISASGRELTTTKASEPGRPGTVDHFHLVELRAA